MSIHTVTAFLKCRPRRRWWATLCLVIVTLVCGRQYRAVQARTVWMEEARRQGLQTFDVSPLQRPEATLLDAVCGLLTRRLPVVTISHETDAQVLIDLPQAFPAGLTIVVSPMVPSASQYALQQRYPEARVTTFQRLWTESATNVALRP